MKHKFLIAFFCIAVFISNAQLQRFSFSQPKMGSPLNIIFYTKDSTTANELAQQCYVLADTLNQIFSDYNPDSELSLLSATAGKDSFVQVSSPLFDILQQSKKAWEQSYHRFDITIGTLSQLWRQARKSKTFPDNETVLRAKSLTGFDKIIIDTVLYCVKLTQAGMQLDLGGIAKGYIAQKIIDYLNSENVHHALADAGGDIVVSNAPPNRKGWQVGINIPQNAEEILPRTLTIQNKAVATSGDIYQFIEHDGKKYSHIINPATGYGVTFQRNVTVIANDGATADWLATACSILSFSKAKKVVQRMGAALLVTYLENGKISFYKTKNFDASWKNNHYTN